eukprot:Rmarinus@m.12531
MSRNTSFHSIAIQGGLNKSAPANYVAGLGRGATGFTTRSDIGPASLIRTLPGQEKAPESGGGDDDDEKDDLRDDTYDEFSGYKEALFKNDPYEEDDKEADLIYKAVDERMDQRRKDEREKREKEEMKKYLETRPKIQARFTDLKRNLEAMSASDWDSIPDIGDYTVKRKKQERFIPAPDSLLEKARQEQESAKSLDARQQTAFGGLETPLSGMATPMADFNQIGQARGTVLGHRLDKVSDSISGQTNIDPKGYLTDLSSINVTSDADVQDIKKARLLITSIINTNPKYGPGWIAAARLEEVAGKMSAARDVIRRGCENAPTYEDVWIESARLHPPAQAKAILGEAVSRNPTSVKIWMQAVELESEPARKKRVLRKALEVLPNSVKLWKAAVGLESEDDARIMLSRAVECCPHAVELWLALAKLETYDNAKKVLNKAREQNPADVSIWITAAKLEEAQGNIENVQRIINLAVATLSKSNVIITRDVWIKHAQDAEAAVSPVTCQAIVRATLGMGIEDMDRKQTWLHDAEQLLDAGSIETARAVYAHALSVFPGKKGIWFKAAHLEKQHGTADNLDKLLRKAVSYCPKAQVLWLMAAREKWHHGDVASARQILSEAFKANPDSEQIWLAAVKLERENNEPERARQLLEKARQRSSTARVWMKSAVLERDLDNTQGEQEMLDRGLRLFPTFEKLHLMRGQLEERRGKVDLAHKYYAEGVRQCPECLPLWLALARLEETHPDTWGISRARSSLERARLRNPKLPLLWLEAIRLELRSGVPKAAVSLLAMGLQACPSSGELWSQAITMEPKPKRSRKAIDALNHCERDPYVIATAAKVFWSDRKIDKARSWFNRAITFNDDIGDHWALLYRFEKQHGDEEKLRGVVDRCVKADPRHGELWCQIRKAPENRTLTTEQVLVKVATMVKPL